MVKCVRIQAVKKIYCLGGLTSRVQIVSRSLEASNTDDVDYEIDKQVVTTLKADISTITGTKNFGDVNINEIPTHKITIKYRSGIDITNQVVVNGKRLRILRVENVNETNAFINLLCTERGLETLEANFS